MAVDVDEQLDGILVFRGERGEHIEVAYDEALEPVAVLADTAYQAKDKKLWDAALLVIRECAVYEKDRPTIDSLIDKL